MTIFNSVYKSFQQGWKPGANTVAYYPLEDDYNDYSGNSRNPVAVGSSVSLSTSTDGYKCTQFIADANSYINFGNKWNVIDVYSTGCTIVFWIGDLVANTAGLNYNNGIIQGNAADNSGFGIGIKSKSGQTDTGHLGMRDEYTGVGGFSTENVYGVNTMHMYTFTLTSGGVYSLYKDDNSTPIFTATGTTSSANRFSKCYMGYDTYDSAIARHLVGKLRQVVFEDRVWTQEDRDLYYNTFIAK